MATEEELRKGIEVVNKGTASHHLGEDSWTGWAIDLVNPADTWKTFLVIFDAADLEQLPWGGIKNSLDGPAIGGELGSY